VRFLSTVQWEPGMALFLFPQCSCSYVPPNRTRIRQVRDNGVANDTIVVFSSDNGPWIDAWLDAGYSPPRNERDRF
jgi:hypothetical protein